MTAVGTTTLMTPPYAQLHFDVELSAGMLLTSTVADPGAHGATVTGVQGPGVSTPSAAAVSDAVAGFDSDMHTPNGVMFKNGLLSMIVAMGLLVASVMFVGSTVIGVGAAPKLHIRLSPITTGCAMRRR